MKVIDDIFDQQELNYIREDFHKNLKNTWEINKYHWQDILTIGTDGFVLMRHVPGKVKNIVLDSIKKHVHFDKDPGIMYYMWTTGSGINWHHDDHTKQACTIYLEDWPIEFGGQLIYKEGRANKLIPVKANRMVVNDNHTEHMVSLVRKNKDKIRFTMQIFDVP